VSNLAKARLRNNNNSRNNNDNRNNTRKTITRGLTITIDSNFCGTRIPHHAGFLPPKINTTDRQIWTGP
jgi:hypothetical protein